MTRARNLKRALGVIAVLCLTATAFAADTVVEEIIARINNQIITRSELQKSREQMLNELRQQGVSETDPRAQEEQRNLLRSLVDQQLLVQKAQDLGLTADTELIKRLDEIRKQMKLESMEDLEKAAQAQGVSYEDFKQNLRNTILTQQVIQREVGGQIHITREEAQQFYNEHKAQMEQPETVQLSEILISPAAKEGEQPTPEDLSAAEQKAREALAQIKGGKDFAEVAKQYSNGPTAAQGGDLGQFKRGTLAKELEDKTFAMKPGEVTDVIRTRQGYVILKVTEHTPAGVPPFNAVENWIQEQIYYRKLQPALRAYLTKLREEAYIDIKPGYVDTGASPNQTKPVIASSTAPAEAEKTKKKKKFLLF
ncbi:MAG: peptidylprolyl isomerase [Terriglobales bacterium]